MLLLGMFEPMLFNAEKILRQTFEIDSTKKADLLKRWTKLRTTLSQKKQPMVVTKDGKICEGRFVSDMGDDREHLPDQIR